MEGWKSDHPESRSHAHQPSSPLARYHCFHSSERDEAQAYVSSIFCRHKLDPRTRNGVVDAFVNHARIGASSLNYLRYGVPVVVDPGELEKFFLVQVQLSGGLKVSCGSQNASIGIGQASVLSPTEAARMDWCGRAAELIVRFERSAAERHLRALLGRDLSRPLVFDLAMDCRAGPAASWLRVVRYIQNELEAQETVLTAPLVVKDFEQALISSLLHCQPHNHSEALQRDVSPAIPRHVKLVEDYIGANADQPICIEDLVNVAGVSARTLFSGFQRFRGTSPMKVLHQVRLRRARQDLETASLRATVTEVALRWGFTQFGRFAVDYRRCFGESPSHTLKRAQRRLS